MTDLAKIEAPEILTFIRKCLKFTDDCAGECIEVNGQNPHDILCDFWDAQGWDVGSPEWVDWVISDLTSTQVTSDVGENTPFQERVAPWMQTCFGAEISADVQERNHRFLEEALELVQAKGCTAGEAHQLVDYVFGRDVGDPHQEVGGVMVTLAALCLAASLDMDKAAEDELRRIWTKVEAIRAKQAAKPKHSPLPQ